MRRRVTDSPADASLQEISTTKKMNILLLSKDWALHQQLSLLCINADNIVSIHENSILDSSGPASQLLSDGKSDPETSSKAADMIKTRVRKEPTSISSSHAYIVFKYGWSQQSSITYMQNSTRSTVLYPYTLCLVLLWVDGEFCV